MPQEGFKVAGGEGAAAADTSAGGESGGPPHNLQGMPLDFFPTPLDPPMYKTMKMEDGEIGGSESGRRR